MVDAFDSFPEWWSDTLAPAHDVALWEAFHAARWPELLRKQIRSYEEDGFDWREVARDKVLPYLAERLPDMSAARGRLLKIGPGVYDAARCTIGIDFDVVFVIYTGIGVGASWATTYEAAPACLFGLENIAELGWGAEDTLAGLCAHELGHLAHQHWRALDGLPHGSGPLWRLYEEGFAMRCEHAVAGREAWHEQAGWPGWLEWCAAHKGQLARELLLRVEQGADAREFFGSWYEVHGCKQCGYYLGHELVKRLEAEMSARPLVTLPCAEVEARMRAGLRAMEAVG